MKPKTQKEHLEFIFKDPIEALDGTRPATMLDIVKHWMFVYDQRSPESPTKNISAKFDFIYFFIN